MSHIYYSYNAINHGQTIAKSSTKNEIFANFRLAVFKKIKMPFDNGLNTKLDVYINQVEKR
jgi:hypothetical protein